MSREAKKQPPTLNVNGEKYIRILDAMRHLGLIGAKSTLQPSNAAYMRKLGVKPDLELPTPGGVALYVKLSRLDELRAGHARMMDNWKAALSDRAKQAREVLAARKGKEKGGSNGAASSDLAARLDRLEAKVDRLLALWESDSSSEVKQYEDTTGAEAAPSTVILRPGSVPSFDLSARG